ncbi:hypothetical protein T12_565 [Trichinella patagoniensis]|uniref:Uncharacterized protein n=1 Tax=Trichinella patagoniensis TaxID=990121 RepID=A0A0V0Z5E4_9BILA|nr:hypothetical protein T12_565 [Trichinella patagoniensis]
MENSSRQRRSFIVETASVSGGRSHSGCSKVASFLTHKCIRHAPAVVWMQSYFEIVTSIPELCEIYYSKLRVNQNTRAKRLAQMYMSIYFDTDCRTQIQMANERLAQTY